MMGNETKTGVFSCLGRYLQRGSLHQPGGGGGVGRGTLVRLSTRALVVDPVGKLSTDGGCQCPALKRDWAAAVLLRLPGLNGVPYTIVYSSDAIARATSYLVYRTVVPHGHETPQRSNFY